MRILVVDDETIIVKGIKFNLENEGYTGDAGYDGEEAVELARAGGYDLIVLDLMMPKKDGLQACQEIRGFSTVPVIMLTARSESADLLMGFESGADDYVTKPFSRSVLLARIQAVLRRPAPTVGGEPFDGLVLDEEARTARLGETEIPLTHAETRTLALLLSSPGRVHTRQRILDAVKGVEQAVTERTVDVQMVGLRRKLSPWSAHIETVRGIGYRLKP